MNLIDSPSYPSGHTTYGYMGALVLAILVPDESPQMITRGAEYGNNSIMMGAHYAMDVIGGRTLAIYGLTTYSRRNDPAYMGRTLRRASVIKDFQVVMTAARADVTASLQAACGNKISVCAHLIGRMEQSCRQRSLLCRDANLQSAAMPWSGRAGLENVAELVPEAGYLLTIAFPALTLEQADQILTETEGPGGGFLDDGSAFGVYSRLNLYAAAGRAAAAAARK